MRPSATTFTPRVRARRTERRESDADDVCAAPEPARAERRRLDRDICTTNVTVIGIGGERATAYAPSLELLARNVDRLPIDRIVTHRMPLEQAAEALELAQADGAMKVVLDPRL